MAKPFVIEVVTERLSDHPAVQAWNRLQSGHAEPESIAILKKTSLGKEGKSTVFRINGIGPDGGAMIAKRCLKATAKVERIVYEEVLPRLPVPTLRFYGFLEEPEGMYCWLFLENAVGEMYSPGHAQHRALAGRWLGQLHLASLPADLKDRLYSRELGHHLQLLRASRATLLDHLAHNVLLSGEDAAVFRKTVAYCDAIEAHWNQMERICQAMPRTLVHSDFVVKNMRIRDGVNAPALLVFDWEYAGWGVPCTDLAQFVGNVTSPDLSVYCSVLGGRYPHLEIEDIQRVAACGNILRMVDKIDWALCGIDFGSPILLIYPLTTLKVYERAQAEALKALEMELT